MFAPNEMTARERERAMMASKLRTKANGCIFAPVKSHDAIAKKSRERAIEAWVERELEKFDEANSVNNVTNNGI